MGYSFHQISRESEIPKTTVVEALQNVGIVQSKTEKWQTPKNVCPRNLHKGVAPYGFGRLRGRLVATPNEIENVRMILKLWQKQKTLRDIATYLNNLGIKTRQGFLWEHSAIRRIINNHKKNPKQIEEVLWVSQN